VPPRSLQYGRAKGEGEKIKPYEGAIRQSTTAACPASVYALRITILHCHFNWAEYTMA
jgi:hypothetical protein